MMKPSSATVTYVAMTLGVGAVTLLAAGLVGSTGAAVVALLGSVYLLYSLFVLVGEVVDYRMAKHRRDRSGGGGRTGDDGDGTTPTGGPEAPGRAARRNEADDEREYVGAGVYVEDIPRRVLDSIRGVFG